MPVFVLLTMQSSVFQFDDRMFVKQGVLWRHVGTAELQYVLPESSETTTRRR